jgi:hypothetical protein
MPRLYPPPVGFYFNYFLATESEALACLDEGPEATSMPQTGDLAQLDPWIVLGVLMAHVEGRPFSHADGGPSPEKLDASIPDSRILVRMDDGSVAQLAAIADEQFRPLAVEWSQSEYWIGSRTDDRDVAELASIIEELRGLARAVDPARGRAMFVWAAI